MFKKPFTLKNQSKVRSSDRRQLWQHIVEAYGEEWLDNAGLVRDTSKITPIPSPDGPTDTAPVDEADSIIAPLNSLSVKPSQAQKMDWVLSDNLKNAKFLNHIDEPGTLYLGEKNQPLWFRIDAANRASCVVPTVYTLWKFPNLLPTFYTHPPVLEKLVSGADLMLPGVIHPPGGLPVVQRGQVVSVAVSGFPAPVAVGLMELSTEEIRTSKTNKGKAVHILHTYQDYLWKQGDQSHPTVPSNEAPVDSEQGKLEDSTYNASTDQGVDKAPAANGPDAPEPELEDVPPALSPVEMDEWLQKCLMQALCTTLNKERLAPLLPLSISALYSSYMMASRPVNIQLDVKKSTFKKLAKFFKTMEKKGILKTKDIKGGDTVVTTVNHQHPELLAFEPMKKSALVTSAPSDGANSGSSRSPGESSALISFTDMFRPRSALVEFIHTAGLEPQPYYTRQELRTIMVDYIKHKQLKDPRQPKLVALDEPLAKLLLCSNEAGISHPHLTHEKIVERLFVATELAHCLTFPDGTTEIRKGSPTKISVIMEKKMGHKTITKISNHELYRLDTDTLAKQLQHACAASVTTHAIPVKGKKLVYHEIIAQGPQGKIVMQLLEKNGVPSSLVDIQDKTGKTKGKK